MDANTTEILRALKVLFQPGDTVELRCVGNRTINGFYRDQDKLAADAHALNTQYKPRENVYVCLNPVQPELYGRRAEQFAVCRKGEAVRDRDIFCRRWLLIDVDAIRPAGVSATDQQKQGALDLATQVYAWLVEQVGGSSIICADSGNGAHMLIRLPDPPADRESAWVCERVVKLLADQFSNQHAKVDQATGNASRICTLYGSTKCKGSDISEQPHRQSKLVYVPDPLQPVDWQQLAALVDPYTGDQRPSQPSGNGQTGEGWQIDQLLQDRQIEYTTSEGCSNSGERWIKYELACPFSREHDDGFALLRWDNGAIAAKCHHDSCQAKGWAELKRIWQLPDAGGISEADITLPTTEQAAAPQDLLIVRSLDVRPEPIGWLWQDRLVVGGINLCCGRGGIGKTFFLCDLVARITNDALSAPNGQPLLHGRVLYSTGEDHLGKIIEPRMQAHGVDRSRLEYIKGLPAGPYVQLLDVIAHADYLRAAIQQRPDTVALVLDPISSFQGQTDSNKVAQVRQFTAVLTQISEEFNIAVLGIHHFNKGRREIAGDSISGSHAYRDAARSTWLFALDGNDPTRRLMVCDKHNWAPQRPPGMAYRIERGRIVYEVDPLDLSPDELLAQGPQQAIDVACSWLAAYLSSGARHSADVQIAAAADGISDRTLNRAKKRLGVKSVKNGTRWTWSLPTSVHDEQGCQL